MERLKEKERKMRQGRWKQKNALRRVILLCIRTKPNGMVPICFELCTLVHTFGDVHQSLGYTVCCALDRLVMFLCCAASCIFLYYPVLYVTSLLLHYETCYWCIMLLRQLFPVQLCSTNNKDHPLFREKYLTLFYFIHYSLCLYW